MASSEVMTSSTHSFAYSYRLVKKCFVKICETSKCHNFLIFQPIFIRFSLLCLKIFTLSSEIKLNLLWSSSLIPCEEIFGRGKKRSLWLTHQIILHNVTSSRHKMSSHGTMRYPEVTAWCINFINATNTCNSK